MKRRGATPSYRCKWQVWVSVLMCGVQCATTRRYHKPIIAWRPICVCWAYLRLLPSMPRTFFDVPSCRFCDLSEGNQWAHVQYCSVLYLRIGHALVALVEEVAQRVCVLSCDMTDLLARIKVPGGVLVVGVVPEQEVQSVSTWAYSVGCQPRIPTLYPSKPAPSVRTLQPSTNGVRRGACRSISSRGTSHDIRARTTLASDTPSDRLSRHGTCGSQFSEWWHGSCMLCMVPRYPGSRICPCACRLGRWGRVARTRCKCCIVMSCGARRLRQDRVTRTAVSCVRVSEGTLRTGTSMHYTIQWLSMCPANSPFQSCNYFDECSVM